MGRGVSFESVATGWVTFVSSMPDDWPSGTGNATRVPLVSIMRLGIPGHLPGLVPEPSLVGKKISGNLSRDRLPGSRSVPGSFPIRATGPVPCFARRGNHGQGAAHGSGLTNPRPTKETQTINDHN